MLLDVHEPIIQALPCAVNFPETILTVTHAREGEAEVEPGHVSVLIDGKGLFQLLARLRISFGNVVSSSKIALNRSPGEIGVIYVTRVYLSCTFEITPGRLIVANTKRKSAGLDVATRSRASICELAARDQSQSWLSRSGIPAANQAPPFALRIRSTGLAQSVGSGGASTSSILKSPSASSGTPVRVLLCSVNGAAASQIIGANTLVACAGGLPIPLPPANTNPFPSTLISPLVSTLASRSLIRQV